MTTYISRYSKITQPLLRDIYLPLACDGAALEWARKYGFPFLGDVFPYGERMATSLAWCTVLLLLPEENGKTSYSLPFRDQHDRMLWQMMKRMCRKIGMPRWPYREIDSINKAMEDLRSLLAGAKTEADRARCGFRCDLWFGGHLSIDCRSGAGRLEGRYFLHAWIRPTMPCILLSGAFLRR